MNSISKSGFLYAKKNDNTYLLNDIYASFYKIRSTYEEALLKNIDVSKYANRARDIETILKDENVLKDRIKCEEYKLELSNILKDMKLSFYKNTKEAQISDKYKEYLDKNFNKNYVLNNTYVLLYKIKNIYAKSLLHNIDISEYILRARNIEFIIKEDKDSHKQADYYLELDNILNNIIQIYKEKTKENKIDFEINDSIAIKQNDKVVLDTIYSTLNKIYSLQEKALIQNINVIEFNNKAKNIEKLLGYKYISNENKPFIKYCYELETILNMMEKQYNNKLEEQAKYYGSKEHIEQKYNEIVKKITSNNKELKTYINQLRDKKEDKRSFLDTIIPNILEYGTLSVIIVPILLTFLTPVNTIRKRNYSSQTEVVEYEDQEERKSIVEWLIYKYSNKKDHIKIIGDEKDGQREVVQYDYESISDLSYAIEKAEKYLDLYKRQHADSTYENFYEEPYYEIELENNLYQSILFIFAFVIGLFSTIGLYDSVFEDYEEENSILYRVIENLKNRKIYNNDLKSVIAYAKYLQSKNSELANELYTLFIDSYNNDNYDEFYARIEELKSETDNNVETIRRLKY